MSDAPWTPPITPAGTGTRPKEIDLAFWIVVVWSIVGVITAIVGMSSGGAVAAEMERQMAATGARMDPAMMSTVAGAASIGPSSPRSSARCCGSSSG